MVRRRERRRDERRVRRERGGPRRVVFHDVRGDGCVLGLGRAPARRRRRRAFTRQDALRVAVDPGHRSFDVHDRRTDDSIEVFIVVSIERVVFVVFVFARRRFSSSRARRHSGTSARALRWRRLSRRWHRRTRRSIALRIERARVGGYIDGCTDGSARERRRLILAHKDASRTTVSWIPNFFSFFHTRRARFFSATISRCVPSSYARLRALRSRRGSAGTAMPPPSVTRIAL